MALDTLERVTDGATCTGMSYIQDITIETLMAAAKGKVRRWGASLGVVIPIALAKDLRLRPGDEVVLEIEPAGGVREAFGSLRDWTVDTQKLKDEARRGW